MLVFLVALAVRLAFVLRSGGFRGDYGYDSGVYYAAADALIHGRVPYREFVLLHPPALMVALTPSALLGRLTTDHLGFASANLGMTIIGAVNAALVVSVGRRLGLGSRAAVIGGLFYALWFGAASAEFLARLEPLGNLFLLAGLLLVTAAFRDEHDGNWRKDWSRRSGWLLALGGAAFGLAASVKIWFVAPLLIVAVWLVVRSRAAQPTASFLAGAIGAAVLLNGPFLLLSRGAMWSRVVVDQLGRKNSAISVTSRLEQLSSVNRVARHLTPSGLLAVVVAIACLLALILGLAWRMPTARLVVLLTLAQLGILLAAPSWFGFYADFAAVPLSLSVAAAAAALPRRVRLAGWLPTAGIAALTLTVIISGSFHATSSWRGAGGLIPAASHVRCVMSDAPNGLIELNALDRDLANGCPNWVDVTAKTYFGADRASVPRRFNKRWQHDLATYLLSGDAVFLVRIHGDGMASATLRTIKHGGLLAATRYTRIYRTAHAATASLSTARSAQAIRRKPKVRRARGRPRS